MSVELDKKLFHKRVQGLVSFWKSSLRDAKEGPFSGADAIAIAVGQSDEEHVYQKSTALQVKWLTGTTATRADRDLTRRTDVYRGGV
jgi:nucleosome binding factor SPN SPT16 subunit